MRVEGYIVKGLAGLYAHAGIPVYVYSSDGVTFSYLARDLSQVPPLEYEGRPIAGILDYNTGEVVGAAPKLKPMPRFTVLRALRLFAKAVMIVVVLGIGLCLALCGGLKLMGHTGRGGSRHRS